MLIAGVAGKLLSTTVSSAGLLLLLGVLIPDAKPDSSRSSRFPSLSRRRETDWGTPGEVLELVWSPFFCGERAGDRESGGGVLVAANRVDGGQ